MQSHRSGQLPASGFCETKPDSEKGDDKQSEVTPCRTPSRHHAARLTSRLSVTAPEADLTTRITLEFSESPGASDDDQPSPPSPLRGRSPTVTRHHTNTATMDNGLSRRPHTRDTASSSSRAFARAEQAQTHSPTAKVGVSENPYTGKRHNSADPRPPAPPSTPRRRKPRGRPFAEGNQLGRKFEPGQSGNPAGRPPSAGASIREWLNIMGEWPMHRVKAAARDENATVVQRAAAGLLVEACRPVTDLADIEPALLGEKSLTELQADGIDTRGVKRLSISRASRGYGYSVETRDYNLKALLVVIQETAGLPRPAPTARPLPLDSPTAAHTVGDAM